MFLLLAATALAQPLPARYDLLPMRYDEPQELPDYNPNKLSTGAVVGYTVLGVVGTVATGAAAVGLINMLFSVEYSGGPPPPAPSPTVQFH
jgi:hypothetical protein